MGSSRRGRRSRPPARCSPACSTSATRPAVDAFLADVTAELGRVDVLVNNAGGTFFAPFVDVSTGGEAALLAENFTQVTRFVRGVVPLMPDAGDQS